MRRTKTCTKCGLIKEVSEFGRENRYKDGYRSRCKKCSSGANHAWNKKHKIEHVSATMRWNRNNPEKVKISRRDYHLRRAYGINLVEYGRMLNLQSGRCSICSTDKSGGVGDFHVDHDHASNKVRGLLCNNCNTMLGLVRESKSTLQSAIEYLARWEDKVA